jgi:hypothetical protein
MSRILLSVLTLVAMSGVNRQGYSQDARAIVQKAVNIEIAADRSDHSCWIFHEVDRKSKSSVTQWVAQTPAGNVVRVMIKDGRQIPQAQQRHAIESFVRDRSAQARQRQDNQRDDKKAQSLLSLLPVAFVWRVSSQDKVSTTLRFSPDPSFHPPTREARVFSAMAGKMTVDNDQHRVKEFEGHLVHNVDFGGGVLGKLKRGGSFRIERSELKKGIWEITQSHIHIRGHALIFKSISEQEDDEKSSFSQEPNSVTLQQAASTLFTR